MDCFTLNWLRAGSRYGIRDVLLCPLHECTSRSRFASPVLPLSHFNSSHLLTSLILLRKQNKVLGFVKGHGFSRAATATSAPNIWFNLYIKSFTDNRLQRHQSPRHGHLNR